MADFMHSPLAKFLKKNGICPVCNVKKIIAATKITADGADTLCNGAALTPPMGWASWNSFRRNINESIIIETAKAMQAAGLDKLGYTYVNIDDCWMSSMRDKDGKLQGDLAAFPSGMKSLVQKINECGFKAGIYTSNGTLTCEDMPSSLGHERTDAETFADWGFEYFKYVFCHNVPIPTAAPEIAAMIISGKNGETICEYTAEEAELRGTAERFADEKFPGGNYIGGLDANGGMAIFPHVFLPEAGAYTLTLYLHRKGKNARYAEIVINGTEVYPVTDPGTKGTHREGRLQATVRFEAGENTVMLHNPVGSRMDSAAKQYRNMGLELIRAAKLAAEKENREVKPICFSVCEWGLNRPWKWGKTAGNLWRTTPDIRPTWTSIVGIYELNVRLGPYAGTGHWNDPDMLEVGNGELTHNENRAHFSVWCMMASPLILGNDIRKLLKSDGTPDTGNAVYKIITNEEMIAIDQDALGIQCKRVKAGKCDVLVKPLVNGELAVCLFNKSKNGAEAGFDINELTSLNGVQLPAGKKYAVRDIWDRTDFISDGKITEHINGRDVKVYRIKEKKE